MDQGHEPRSLRHRLIKVVSLNAGGHRLRRFAFSDGSQVWRNCIGAPNTMFTATLNDTEIRAMSDQELTDLGIGRSQIHAPAR